MYAFPLATHFPQCLYISLCILVFVLFWFFRYGWEWSWSYQRLIFSHYFATQTWVFLCPRHPFGLYPKTSMNRLQGLESFPTKTTEDTEVLYSFFPTINQEVESRNTGRHLIDNKYFKTVYIIIFMKVQKKRVFCVKGSREGCKSQKSLAIRLSYQNIFKTHTMYNLSAKCVIRKKNVYLLPFFFQ